MAVTLRNAWFVFRAVCFTLSLLCLPLPPHALAQSPLPDNFNPGASTNVLALAVQTDGKILIAGTFTNLDGQPRNFLGRLNADGTVDSGFNPVADNFVHSLAVQEDGKILVGGTFGALGGQPRSYLSRLNTDGTLDNGFNPGASSVVRSLEVQTDGKIVVGGAFTSLGGETHQRLGRLNADGTPDSAFNPAANGFVFTLAVLADGKMVVGGQFTNLNGQARWRIARLEAGGILDGSFVAEANGMVRALAVQTDGKILVSGTFTMLNGQPRNNIGRLNTDGTLDSGFNPGANGGVLALAVQANGKILAGGDFTWAGGQARDRIARFHADGTLDGDFNPGASRTVSTLAVQPDGKSLLGGTFATLGGQPRKHIARLNNTEPATQSLTSDGLTVTWRRGGASPEVSRTTFDYTTDGVTWIGLGAGERIAGGWQVSGVTLPSPVTIRGRGNVAGDGTGSRWVVETYGGNITLLTQPLTRTNDAATTATLSVSAIGEAPLHYQWWKDGAPLADGGYITGATTRTLTLSNLLEAAEGSYSVVVSNALGVVTSQVATLTVIDPTIASEPVSQQRNVRDTVTFNVAAAGTALTYQWLKDGAVLSDDGRIGGTTTPAFSIANALKTDEGGYSVVVSNSFGSVTSRVATLTVVDPAITSQPLAQTRNAGANAIFNVAAAGTGLIYQWLKDGVIVIDDGRVVGAGTASLTVNNLLNADEGGYSVVISNPSGSATSQVATLTVIDPAILSQLTNQTRNAGETVTLQVTAAGTAALSYEWFKNGVPIAPDSGPTLTLANVQYADTGNYSVVVSNGHGSVTNAAQLTVRLVALDTSFNPVVDFWGFFDLKTLALQPDGRIIAGGEMEKLGGYTHRYIVRLDTNGALLGGFNPGPNDVVRALAVQEDGKIVVAAKFAAVGEWPQRFIKRFHTSGMVDTSFDPRANNHVTALGLQPDEKIVVGGYFTTMADVPRTNIARLHPDGRLDAGFNVAVKWGTNSGGVDALAVQPDGRILIGGQFNTVNGQPHTNIARLNADGTVDGSFNAAANGHVSVPAWDGWVNVLALQADGKILLSGNFTRLNEESRPYFGRLNADGTRDITFNPGVDGFVNAVALQADGRILMGGKFSSLNGQAVPYFGRLNADGTVDQGFRFEVNRDVSGMALQTDGKILVGGFFSRLGGEIRSNFARLTLFEPATQRLGYDGSSVTWLRGGTSPEVWRTAFDFSLDGTNWIRLGEGTRVPGGWRVPDVSLPLDVSLRARGHVVGGSPWVAETVVTTNSYVGPLFVVTQPVSQTTVSGSVAMFSVWAVGTQPLAYQWWKDGAPLSDGGAVAGATGPTLTLSNVLKADEGGYSVIVSNAQGSVTSHVASLTVLDPTIISQPFSQVQNAGQSATLSVEAAGTALVYQWLKDGTALADDGRITGAATAALTVLDLLKPDQGGYSVAITGTHGSVTSVVAALTVVDPVIASHPASQFQNQGEGVALSVIATGTAPLNYQWWKDGLALPEAVGSTLTLTNLQPADSGNYFVVVNNGYGSVTSRVAGVTVIALAIVDQPLSLQQIAGQYAEFMVTADGLGLSYQWFYGDTPLVNGGKISGARTPMLTVSNLLKADEGGYSVVVSTSVGSVTSSVATLTVIDPVITRHPEHQSRNPGETVAFSVTAAGTLPVSYQWRKDGETVPGATDSVLSITNLQQTHLGAYSVVVANSYGSATSEVAQLIFNYTTLETAFEPGAQVTITAAAVQPDGKILIGGQFAIPDALPRYNLARFHANGYLDGSFRMDNAYTVSSLAVLPDGKILVGGQSIRLHSDGTRDTNFTAARPFSTAMAVEPGGNIVTFILIPQWMTYPQPAVVRLNWDGSLNRTLIGGVNSDFWLYVKSIVMLPSGTIYMAGGDFISGPLPDYFIGPATVGAAVDSMIAQPDGTAYLYGALGRVNGVVTGNFIRLVRGGSVDTSFTPPGSASPKVVQADGKLIVSTGFNWPDGRQRPYSRLNTNGTLDESLDLGHYLLHSLLPDGRILAGHWTTNSDGLAQYRLTRLTNTEPATESLTYDGSTITWLRGGTGPEVWYASFDYSVNGRDWFDLGAGQLIRGGWRLTNAPASIPGTIRARGLVAMGALRSHWVVEAFVEGTSVGFITHPSGRLENAGATANFSVTATGEAPLSYQWLKDGVPLADGGNLVGAATSSLSVSNVLRADEGGYSVVISNVIGVVTSRVARLTVRDPIIFAQPVSQTRNPGESVTFSVTARGTPPLSYQWRHYGEDVVVPDGTGSTLTLDSLQAPDAGDYTVVVSNGYGSVTSTVAQLAMNLVELDSGFEPGTPPSLPFFSELRALAAQPDGKVLVSGYHNVPGTAGWQSATRLLRMNADGTPDEGFVSQTNLYRALALQTDGKIVATRTLTGNTSAVVRVHANGTFDGEFSVTVNGTIETLAAQADGKILAGGLFATLDGSTRTNLVRINPDGTVDAAFNPRINGIVRSLAMQTDEKILVSGDFSMVGGQTRAWIARINADGTIDQSFNTTFLPAANNWVNAMVVQPDGKFLAGGSFITPGAPGRPSLANLVRFHPSGALDTGFHSGPTAHVGTLALQADGKILVGGGFGWLGGQMRQFLGRLNPDGTLDPSFSPTATGFVRALGIQSDGKILVGGMASRIIGSSGQPARLINNMPAVQTLSRSGSTITWLRGGASPEAWSTTFEYSTDRVNWTSLGAGTRIPGGWALTNVAAPPGAHIRARGYVTGGFGNASSWFVEAYSGYPPTVLLQPASRTNVAGSSVTFGVSAGWTDPLSYQWMKDGVPLTDIGNFSGTATPRLTVTNLLKGDEGSYSVVVSNVQGRVTSQLAWLTVVDPAITIQPLNQHRNVGESVTFSVAASGTLPLTYQWWKQGVAEPLGDAATLTLSQLQLADAGYYTVVVGNGYGSVTSAVAQLTMNRVTLDSGFTPETSGSVRTVAIQPDGKILAGGYFNLQPPRRILRMHSDGTLEGAFDPAANGSVYTLALQADGKILVGGTFTSLGGQTRKYIGRLNADGTLDEGFDALANSDVFSLVALGDGRILAGGYFTTLAGTSRRGIARLHADGTVDSGFNAELNGYVHSMSVQADGMVLVGGQFTAAGAQPRTNLARFHADGELDASFNPPANNYVTALAVQADGKILVGGYFSTLAGHPRPYLGRLNTNGTLDGGFDVAANGVVESFALQSDGKIVLGGGFTILNGQPCKRIGRLNADGTLDTEFNPEASDGVNSVAIQDDGKLLVGGFFGTLASQPCNHFARLNNFELASQSLTHNGSVITWLRGGSSPEVWRTTFDYSVDGLAWTSLGAGTRISGGWQLDGIVIPPGAVIRARGHVVGGYWNSSGWFVESRLHSTAPMLLPGEGNFGLLSNRFEFHVLGLPGQTVVVEVSTNLLHWTPLQTNTVGTAPLNFTDPDWLLWPQRFYRARTE